MNGRLTSWALYRFLDKGVSTIYGSNHSTKNSNSRNNKSLIAITRVIIIIVTILVVTRISNIRRNNSNNCRRVIVQPWIWPLPVLTARVHERIGTYLGWQRGYGDP